MFCCCSFFYSYVTSIIKLELYITICYNLFMVFQGLKRSSNISSLCQESCIPNKQALWEEKKKRKIEKKRKLSKRNKIQCNKQPVEFVGNEMFLISSFLKLSNTFLKNFFEKDWKAVVSQLETNALRSFEQCLKMISDCLQWLHWFLTTSNELKRNFVSNKKRLELTNNVLEVLSDLFSVLQQYICKCSKIKTQVAFDHRLYFDSDRRLRFPLASCDQVIAKCVDKENCFTRMFSFDALLSGKASQRLDVAIDREFMNRSEWKLKLNYGRLCKNRDTCVRLINHERVFDLVLDHLNEPADLNTSHKMLKVVDDFLIWSEWQWKFLDGWIFSSDYLYYNYNWLNKFNVTSLEYFTSFARIIFFLKNCILYSTEAIFSNKRCSPKCQLLWNADGFDLINTKTTSLSILLQEGKGWYYGVMWISKEPCNPWQPFCENSCCIGWDSSDVMNSRTVQENLPLQKAFKGKTARSHISKQKRDEVKIKRYTATTNSKTSGRPSANEQPVLNKIIDGKTGLPEEKQQSLCILQ